MKTLLYQALGRASVVADPLRALLTLAARPAHGETTDAGRDGTGLLLAEARPLQVLHADEAVLYVRYPSLAHSFWRAQELSLMRQHASDLEAPLLDFGSGDGSFASALFARVEWGADTDPDALARARGYGLYRSLVPCTDDRIPLPDNAAASVFSNSVLEHVGNPEAALVELARVLRPGGRLAFTVPLARLTEHMTKWFGARAAAAANRESSHRNLFEADEWLHRLNRVGLTPMVVRQYQPDWFTFWYRMLRLLGPRALGRLPGVHAACWRVRGTHLVRMVRESIANTADGANLFVLARKGGVP